MKTPTLFTSRRSAAVAALREITGTNLRVSIRHRRVDDQQGFAVLISTAAGSAIATL